LRSYAQSMKHQLPLSLLDVEVVLKEVIRV